MLLSPDVGTALQDLGVAVRYHSSLTDRARELAILQVAAKWDCAFERYAHEAVGRRVGLAQHEILAVRDGTPLELDDPFERSAAAFVAALLDGGNIGTDFYEDCRAALGDCALFELTTLVGYYATLALQLRVFDVSVPG